MSTTAMTELNVLQMAHIADGLTVGIQPTAPDVQYAVNKVGELYRECTQLREELAAARARSDKWEVAHGNLLQQREQAIQQRDEALQWLATMNRAFAQKQQECDELRRRQQQPAGLLVAGVRCRRCGQWRAVAEGNVVPWCCLAVDFPVGLILEHRPATELWEQPAAGPEVLPLSGVPR